ncbi:MAG: cyclic pyranopterin monophosphate synthase MoaC [bacterium]
MTELTHFDERGRPHMVDVSDKPPTARRAKAQGKVVFSKQTYAQLISGDSKKGDIRKVSELAGIAGAKKTSDLIPLCHPLPLTHASVRIEPIDNEYCFLVIAETKTTGKTGVEMEALTAVATACLTIYDMVKALDKSMTITDIKLCEKSGGTSGDFINPS